MRRFGRQCRGQSRIFLKLVRETEHHLLEAGQAVQALAHQASALLAHTPTLSEPQKQHLAARLQEATANHERLVRQSKRLVNGKKLSHGKIVNAYDTTIAAIVKGKSNCPAQFGRKPGIASEPATGFIFATMVPTGNPSDLRYVVPLIDKVEMAIQGQATAPRAAIHSVAGDLGIHDEALRHALHERGMLTVGIPKTVDPINPEPSPEDILKILNDAGVNRKRTPYQVQLASACGASRPVVESHIASLLARGAGQVRYKGHSGAVIQQGMTVMAHNAATLVRIQQQQVSKRAQKFRRLLRLKTRKINEINIPKN